MSKEITGADLHLSGGTYTAKTHDGDVMIPVEPEVKSYDDFAEEVWDVLSRVDVTDHAGHLPKTKKRPAVAYLPWHKAWNLVKREFPATMYEHSDDLIHNAGSVEVEVNVIIRKDWGDSPAIFAMARLAVMDHFFNAILDPNSREINDARQRCLVKALAFAGLGLNLWSESPMPVGRQSDPISKKQLATLEKLIDETGTDIEFFEEWCECKLVELPKERYASAHGLLTAKKGKK